MRTKNALVTIAAFCLASLAHSIPPPQSPMSSYFHWQPAETPAGWVLFLPGSGGLRVLDDDQHYFNVAERLNRRGWSVLLVDYKPAHQAGNGPKGTTAEKIAWVTEQAIGWLRKEHPETSSQPLALVGWSLGSEGVFRIVNDRAQTTALGIDSAVVYYPSNQGKQKLNNQVPLLVLTGEADDVTRIDEVKSFVQSRGSGAATVELHSYPGAFHGFDVASLTERKTLRILPWIGPKATLQFDEGAALDAERRMVEFLVNHAAGSEDPHRN